MKVNGKRIRADFVARDGHGNLHIFEAKHGSGGLTKNQKASGVFDMKSPSNNVDGVGGGTILPSKGKTGTFQVATGNTSKNRPIGPRGTTSSATFHILHY